LAEGGMGPTDLEIDALLEGAGRGDVEARQRLLMAYRDRLRHMVAVRLDRRVAARFDPSDVLPQALIYADARLDDVLSLPPRRLPGPAAPAVLPLAAPDRLGAAGQAAPVARQGQQARRRPRGAAALAARGVGGRAGPAAGVAGHQPQRAGRPRGGAAARPGG